jgi:hypothetical protein
VDLLRWVAIGVAAFVLLLALADLPFVRGTTRNGEIIGDCVSDKGGTVAESADSLRFARADAAASRIAELGGTTLGESKEVAVRLAPISEGRPPYELVVVAKQPFNALVRPDHLRKVVEHPDSFPLVAYMRPADDSRGRRFWDCVDRARKN